MKGELMRFVIGRALLQAGLKTLPPGKVRAELTQLIDCWATKVQDTLANAENT